MRNIISLRQARYVSQMCSQTGIQEVADSILVSGHIYFVEIWS